MKQQMQDILSQHRILYKWNDPTDMGPPVYGCMCGVEYDVKPTTPTIVQETHEEHIAEQVGIHFAL